jgi:hypothetical protein
LIKFPAYAEEIDVEDSSDSKMVIKFWKVVVRLALRLQGNI